MKCCYRCKTEKPLSEFHRCASAPDGHGRECAVCKTARRRARTPEQKRTERTQYKNRHRDKHRAQKALQKAVARGTVVRPDACERCGGTPVQGHHPDYSKRFEVAWLCPRCHGEEHAGWTWPAAA